MLELIGFLEEKFGIRIEDDELVPDNLNSLEKITFYKLRKQVEYMESYPECGLVYASYDIYNETLKKKNKRF